MTNIVNSINQRLLQALKVNAARPAIYENDVIYSYRWLSDAVASTASRMEQLSVTKGDRVAFQLRNSREAVVLLLSTLMIGAIPVPILPSYRQKELRHILQLTRPKMFALQRGTRRYDPLADLQRLFSEGISINTLIIEGYEGADKDGRYLDLQSFCTPMALTPPLEAEMLGPDDTAMMLLSSGTTGLPKAIARKNGGYSGMIEGGCDVFALDHSSVYLAAMPVSHGFIINCPGILGTLSRGGAVALADTPSAQEALDIIERCKVTHTTLVPALLLQWSEWQQQSQHNLSSLWHVQVGGARISAELAQRASSILGITLQQCYGMSEGLLCFSGLADSDVLRFNSQGRALSMQDEIIIVDEQGAPLPAGQVGELITRGPYTITEYYQNPEANFTSFTRDGFYRTGDLAHVDRAGNVFIAGRVNDAINRGGEKFSPNEIEEVAEQHPSVAKAACIGIDDALYGEVPCLFVASNDDALTLGTLRRFFETQGVAAFKAPEKLVFLDTIPMKGIGKIDRLALREIWRQQAEVSLNNQDSVYDNITK
ncbi:AMP-binding protein [Rouxiella sp. Mn2063]|uniref:AMP-binding protein n=1 Tax=Rouxiella sp. Mn2063 TaxID=3395262 RepID=UPI003BE51C50